ncbi:MAG: aspartate 1-decarboxylase [Moorellaceae bacterium]
MWRIMMKSKIHRATVTAANLNYVGSITIDSELLEAADILPQEKVQVVNINNGARFETYAIAGERGSGMICVNGAAARLVQPGDIIIIISYGFFPDDEARKVQPKVILVDENNRLKECFAGEQPPGSAT